MERGDILFVVFLSIFVATAFITLLGVIKRLTIDPTYLKRLFTLLILQVVAIVLVLGKQLLLDSRGYEVWEVMGKVDLPTNDPLVDGVIVEVQPKPNVSSNGYFNFFVLAKWSDESKRYELPALRFNDNATKTFADIQLDKKWDSYATIKPTRNEDQKRVELHDVKLIARTAGYPASSAGAIDASQQRSTAPLNLAGTTP